MLATRLIGVNDCCWCVTLPLWIFYWPCGQQLLYFTDLANQIWPDWQMLQVLQCPVTSYSSPSIVNPTVTAAAAAGARPLLTSTSSAVSVTSTCQDSSPSGGALAAGDLSQATSHGDYLGGSLFNMPTVISNMFSSSPADGTPLRQASGLGGIDVTDRCSMTTQSTAATHAVQFQTQVNSFCNQIETKPKNKKCKVLKLNEIQFKWITTLDV